MLFSQRVIAGTQVLQVLDLLVPLHLGLSSSPMGPSDLGQRLHQRSLGPPAGVLSGLEPPLESDAHVILPLVLLLKALNPCLRHRLAVALHPLLVVVDGLLQQLVLEAFLVFLDDEGRQHHSLLQQSLI